MLCTPALRRLFFSVVPFFLWPFPWKAQSPQPPRASAVAPIPMEQEYHHHLVFENSYVKAFYVEIAAHDSTLYHRHDLPYVSLPPPAAAGSARSATPQGGLLPPGPEIGYTAGGFSHAVSNRSDVVLRNVAIELLHPQGVARNRCAEAVHGEPLHDCDQPTSSDPSLPSHYTVFETDEIVVEYLALPPEGTFTSSPHSVMLVGGLRGVTTSAPEGVRSSGPFFDPRSGLVWLPAGSATVFKATPGGAGHFLAIEFKDAKPVP